MNGRGRGVALTNHAVGRFHERFRPALDQIRARRELEMLIEHGEITDSPPEWMARKARQEADAYLVIGDDMVIPLAANSTAFELEWVAVTCLDRGGISEIARKRRNERGRRRRAARNSRRRR